MIGEPPPAIVELERAGLISGKVLDVGCGAGEHTIMLTGLGYEWSASTTRRRRSSSHAGTPGPSASMPGSKFADAMNLGNPGYDTIVDSALFHIFDEGDRVRYVRSLHGACALGGVVHLLALSDRGHGFGPEVNESDICGAFGDEWVLEASDSTTSRGVNGESHVETFGKPAGSLVDEPAWPARVRRV